MSRSIGSSILAILGRKGSAILISIIFTPVLIRLLGAGAYGRYATIISIFGLTAPLLNSGTNDSIRKYLSEDRDTKWKSSIFGFHIRVAGLIALLLAGGFAFAAASGLVESLLGPEFTPLIMIFAGYILARQSQSTLIRSLMGLKLEKISEPLQITRKVIFSAAAIGLAYFGWGVPGVLFASIVADVMVALVASYLLSQYLHLSSIFSFENPLPKRDVLTYAGGTALFFGCLMSLYHVDILMLIWWTEDSTVGYYKGALAIAELLWFVPSAIQLSMLQSTSEYWQYDKLDALDRLSSQITRLATLLVLLMAIGLAVLADSFVPLYLGSDFEAAVTPLLLLLPGVIGFAVTRPVLAISQAKGEIRPIIFATLASALINFGANAILIPTYGMVGAAIGTSLGYGSLPLFQSSVARNFGYSPFTNIRAVRIVATAVPTAVLLYSLDIVIQNDLVALVVIPPVGALIYLIFAIKGGAITNEDIESFQEKISECWIGALLSGEDSDETISKDTRK